MHLQDDEWVEMQAAERLAAQKLAAQMLAAPALAPELEAAPEEEVDELASLMEALAVTTTRISAILGARRQAVAAA